MAMETESKNRPSPVSSEKGNTLNQSKPQDVEDQTEQTPTPLRDGGYGWVCVGCNLMINAHTWGIVASYGVVLSYYLTHHTFPGTTSTTYAFIGGLFLSQGVLTAPLATYLVRKFGTH